MESAQQQPLIVAVAATGRHAISIFHPSKKS
jgi:hypothetical protein